ncbi:MAG: helix-hairpin-helix domain-containing protein [Bradymonadaceae bacterium]
MSVCLSITVTAIVIGAGFYLIRSRRRIPKSERIEADPTIDSTSTTREPGWYFEEGTEALNTPGDEFDDYLERFGEAEQERKDGNGKRAAPLYEQALDLVESAVEKDFQLPPAPYREYAKMLYHLGEPDQAVGVIDRYIAETKSRNRTPKPKMAKLRDRLANRDFRRLPNKYASEDEEDEPELEDLPGVGPGRAESLREAGFDSVAAVAAASVDELTEVPGIGEATGRKIHNACNEQNGAAKTD